jgi:hypothetical protein
MTSLRRFSFILAVLVCAVVVHAQTEMPNVTTINPTFTTIDIPGATVTQINGINTAGEMVGWYTDVSGGYCPCHSFLLSGGNFSFFDYPGAASTLAYAINDSGLIAGYEGDQQNIDDKGFFYNGSSFTSVQRGQNTRTFVYGVNNAGQMVGGTGTASATKAFLLQNGKFQVIRFPGFYVYAYGSGINNFGQIVGWSDNNSYLYVQGKFKSIAFPGSSKTIAQGINDSGITVGWYAGTQYSGFAYEKGKYVSFDYPGAVGTFPVGVNASGQVVGSYTFDYQTFHGFITSPITADAFR